MMAMASCSLHLSLLYSDEIILTFSQKHVKSSGAFHTTAEFSIIQYMKSDLVHFGTQCTSAAQLFLGLVFTHSLFL